MSSLIQNDTFQEYQRFEAAVRQIFSVPAKAIQEERLSRNYGCGNVLMIQNFFDSGDRRGTLIQLTERGFDTIEKAVAAPVANGEQILQTLTESERQALSDLLRKLLLSLEP